jgi:hypothetical protein
MIVIRAGGSIKSSSPSYIVQHFVRCFAVTKSKCFESGGVQLGFGRHEYASTWIFRPAGDRITLLAVSLRRYECNNDQLTISSAPTMH